MEGDCVSVTNLRKELIKLYDGLVERFPDVVMYYNDLELFKSEKKITRRFPIGKFALDVMERFGFFLEIDEGYIPKDGVIRTYEYYSNDFPNLTIEVKSIEFDKVKDRLNGKKYHLSVSPSGEKKIVIYSLWYDTHNGEMEKEYSTQNEIFFCQYLLQRERIVNLMKHYNFKTHDYASFHRDNILIETYFGMKSCCVYMKDEDGDYVCIYDGNTSRLKHYLRVISENKLWKKTSFDKDVFDI